MRKGETDALMAFKGKERLAMSSIEGHIHPSVEVSARKRIRASLSLSVLPPFQLSGMNAWGERLQTEPCVKMVVLWETGPSEYSQQFS